MKRRKFTQLPSKSTIYGYLILSGGIPESFKGAYADAKNFLDEYNPRHKIIILNAWNEWTEGSYLLPEKKYGDAYLKAIKQGIWNREQ